MRPLPHCLHGSMLALALGWAVGAGTASAAPIAVDSEARSKSQPTVERLRRALDQTVSFEIANQTLEEVAAKLKALTKLNFVADSAMVQQFPVAEIQGGSKQGGITLRLENLKLRTGFRTLLSEYDLGYAILGEVIVLSREDLANQLQVRQRISVDWNEMKLSAALKQLARDTGTNLMLDCRLKKELDVPVTLTLDDVPLETAVRLIANAADLKTVILGNVIVVTNTSYAAQLQADQGHRQPLAPGVRASSPPAYSAPQVLPAPPAPALPR